MKAAFLKALRALLPADGVLHAPEDCAPYGTDWTGTPGAPGAVVLPRSVSEISSILKLCSKHKVPVVPSGGRTGLAGGAVAGRKELVLSLGRLDTLGKPSALSRTVRVGAGAITQNVHQHCENAGMIWPIDLASKGSCQIGGNLSTNAGGLRVIRYGMARKWVTSLSVVKMDGHVLELNAELEKNNTGYDLLQLIVGSEGTLGVIAEATLKLTPIPKEKGKTVFLFALKDLKGLPYLFEKCREAPFEILAFEFFSQECLNAVGTQLKRSSRLAKMGAYYVLTEVLVDGSADQWMESILASPHIVDAMLAESSEDRKAVWGLREGITESLARTARLRKHDLSVPIHSVADFLKDVQDAVRKPKRAIDIYLFGHFGDGSPHVNLLAPPGVKDAVFDRDCDLFEPTLFSILQKYHGSISSEHGIGLLKKKWLSYSRSKTEIEIFKSIKAALDPKGLLNPGKVFDT